MGNYECHKSEGASTAVITFGSFQNPGRDAPPYAFVKSCLSVQRNTASPFDVFYFSANENDWYFSGIKGFGKTLPEAANGIAELLTKYDRKIFIGNSMGGYAALAFGVLIGASQILAFSPQTRFDAEFRRSIADSRWQHAISLLQRNPKINQYAVAQIWKEAPVRFPEVSIYVGGNCAQDIAYAEELREIKPEVSILILENGTHDLAHSLRDSGELERLIRNAIEPT